MNPLQLGKHGRLMIMHLPGLAWHPGKKTRGESTPGAVQAFCG
jgi:hypothetical protein